MFKKTTFLILSTLMLSGTYVYSQQPSAKEPDYNFIRKQITQVQKEKNLSEADVAEIAVTDHYINRKTGAQHIYLRQSYNGLEILGTESAVHIQNDGTLLVAHGNFENSLQKRLKGESTPAISAVEAVQSVANQMGYSLTESPVLLSQESGADMKSVISKGGISISDIPARLMYLLQEDKSIVLVWDLSIEHISKTEWYNFRVDAATGQIINKISWISSCNFEHDHSHDEYIQSSYSTSSVTATTVSEQCEENVNTNNVNYSALLTGTYNVIALPLESPLYGSRSIVNGATAVNTVASPYGWHDTNGVIGAEYTVTRGNNVNAYEDGDNSGFQPDGGPTLVFDYPFNPVYSGGDQSESAAITNLFYWSNIIHDITYMYGFDEASGNFQANNYGNGGLGNDWVRAEAQDGSGTCNANFATPPDGSLPRMQMYICNSRDGDFDNLVITHEYGHGISNRMTGGPGNSGCLGNQEQMGEGWSDWYGLMYTMQSSDVGTDARGVGTYLFGQGPGGSGIRTHPYSTDMSVNPHTYDDIKTEAVPHGVGSVWAMMLWEMTWGLIDEYGFDPDVYNGTGGNNIALALVTEGLRLQPCSPGFVDGRDAILLADQNLYGGANQCIIWEAFAKRGLGVSADQGSSSSRSDGTEAFDTPTATASLTAFGEICDTAGLQTGLSGGTPFGGVYSGPGVTDDGNGSTYTFDPVAAGIGIHTITYSVPATDCTPASSDTDDIEVTPGMEITFCPDDITVDADPTTCDVVVNYTDPEAISGCPYTETEDFDSVNTPTLPGGWTMTQDVGTAISWVTTTTQSASAPNSAFANNASTISASSLVSPTYSIDSSNAKLEFDIYYATESGFDGSVLEYSTNAGGTWQDILIGGTFVSGAYNGNINNCCSNPLGGRQGWTGNSGGFVHAEVALDASFDGEDVLFRWRMGADFSVSSIGVWVDNIAVTGVVAPPPTITLVSGIPSGGAFPIGTTTNVFEISDGSGVLTCSFDVTVVDVTDPTINPIDDLELDASNNCNGILPDYTDLAVVSDNCDSDLEVSQDPAPGTEISGTVTITLTVTDDAGNFAETSFDVTVVDNSPPVVITQNIMAPLDVDGQVIITPADIDNGSWDNCGIDSMSVSPDTFTCADIGPHTVTLTVVDVNGLSASATAQVNVADVMPPDVIGQDITVPLGPGGTVNITPADVDGGTTDNCNIASMSIFPSSFTCNNIGTNNVTLEVFDTSGNSASVVVEVTIVDDMAPVLTCPDDYTVEVSPGNTYTLPDYWGEGEAAAEDNCTDPVTEVTQDPAPGTELGVGEHTVELTATDDYGNTATCSFVVTVTEVSGIDGDEFNNQSVVLFPNPTNNLVTVVNNSNQTINQILITDVNGRTIDMLKIDNNASITLSFLNYSSGVYFVKILSDSSQIVKRIIKR